MEAQPLKTLLSVPRDITAKRQQLDVLVSKYSRMERWLDLSEIEAEQKSLTLRPKYIQLGSEFFVHKNQNEHGLKEVHRLNFKTIKDF